MLRIVPWTRAPEASLKLLEAIKFDFSLFVLSIEFCAPAGDLLWLKEMLAPERGYYRMRAQIHLRSEQVAALLKRHKLMNTEMYLDAKGDALASSAEEKAEKTLSELDIGALEKIPQVMIDSFKAGWHRAGVVCLTLNNLQAGLEIAGSMDEIRVCQSALTGAVDKAHGRLLFALGFDQGAVIIVSPGKPPKKDKDKKKGGPPSSWK